MSFGFSIGDIIKLVELTTQTYNGWKNACGTYATVTDDLAILRTLLSRMEAEARTPNSLFSSNDVDLQHWRSLSKDCHKVIKDLASILNKYKSLSTSRAKNWDRIRLDNKKLAGLEARLSRKIEGITAFTAVIGISSQGRVENGKFPELQRKVDMIAAEMRRGNRSICTISTYDDDDKTVWREFRGEMIRAGFKSGDIHKYKVPLKTYLLRLQRKGLLDEEEVSESLHEGTSDNSPQEQTVVEPEKSSKRVTTIEFPAKRSTLPPSDHPPSLQTDSYEPKAADSPPKLVPEEAITASSSSDACDMIGSLILETHTEQDDSLAPQVQPDAGGTIKKDFKQAWLSPDIIRVLKDCTNIKCLQGILYYGIWIKPLRRDFTHSIRPGEKQREDHASRFFAKVFKTSGDKRRAIYQLAVLPASQVSFQLFGQFNSVLLEFASRKTALIVGVDECIESDTDIYIFMEWYIGTPHSTYLATSQSISEFLSETSDESFHSYAKRLIDGVSPHE